MTHHMIRRFQLQGILIETKMPQVRESSERLLVGMMKDMGWLPLLDIDPVWHVLYLGEERYEYTLTYQGVYVGEDVAWKHAGIAGGKLIPSSPKDK